jgi:hypothetical protein
MADVNLRAAVDGLASLHAKARKVEESPKGLQSLNVIGYQVLEQ